MGEDYLSVCSVHKQAHKIGQSLPTPITDPGRVKDVNVVCGRKERRQSGRQSASTLTRTRARA